MAGEHGTSGGNLPALTDQPENRLIGFVRDHPVAVLAGAAAFGMVVSALLPKRAAGKLAGRAAQLVEIATVAGMALGRDAMAKAGETGGDIAERARAMGGEAYGRAQRTGSRTAERLEDLIVPATRAATAAGERIIDAAERVRKRIRH